MRLVHYSKDEDFEPQAIDSAGIGEGCFFYPEGAECDAWAGRTRTVWYAPDEVVEEFQRFEPGEIGNDDEIVEVFVAAKNLYLVRR